MEVWKLYVLFYNLQMLAVFEFTLPEIIRFPKNYFVCETKTQLHNLGTYE